MKVYNHRGTEDKYGCERTFIKSARILNPADTRTSKAICEEHWYSCISASVAK